MSFFSETGKAGTMGTAEADESCTIGAGGGIAAA